MTTENRSQCISTASEARQVPLAMFDDRGDPQSILMCDPFNFEVKDVKNAFMEGHVDSVDRTKAGQQWQVLKETFEKLGYRVHVLGSQKDLEDMVFAANQVMVGFNQQKYVVLSRMKHQSRRREVPLFAKWFADHGYKVLEFGPSNPDELIFEGQGDAIWHPGKNLLWGGWGHRTQLAAHAELSKLTGSPVITLRLVHPEFYHLDTAFCPLDQQTVVIYPPAFEQKGLDLIKFYFPEVIPVSHKDAHNFACNALSLGKNVVLQKGSSELCQSLKEREFKPVEVDTSEFMKSGGSVFCLKMMVYD